MKIEKNVTPPPSNRGPNKWPFKDMEVGDSFHVPSEASTIPNIRCAASNAGIQLGFKFSVRRTADGCRVWRVQ